ncbi:TetR/AcrR family transcriptional regulator [Geminicoccus flavidas]|uniref:TetR/AcrR family transcriptional regulator n=1 Tax=Geminicoccus flavidas TaxID=2506407 RepID=UPI001358DE49|nr:TetR/AcrR family transcriptional regulator [Geminicoccus flavidas]
MLEQIGDASIAVIQSHGIEGLTFAAVAAEAGLPERTLYRHAANRARLLEIVWDRLNVQLGMPQIPDNPSGLRDLPRQTFQGFDRFEALIRATLHTDAGRGFRLQTASQRAEAFARALAPVAEKLAAADAETLAAGMQLLNSAAAWEFLRDYRGLDGRGAGAVASRLMEWLLRGIETERNDGAKK